jgi:hypothetical protein
VVHGLGGIGKTQLAVAYTKQNRENYSAVFWLNARDEVTLKQGFTRLAERISRESPSAVYVANAVQSRDRDEAVRAVRRWLDEPKNSRWLLICDNYDNPTLNGRRDARPSRYLDVNKLDSNLNSASQSYDIRPLLPDTYHGAILITTRSA